MTLFNVPLFDNDIYKLLFRFGLNLIVITIIIHFLYYRRTRRKEYHFTYYLISFVVFFLTFTLKKYEMDVGMALGLFAIFGIIRYRTEPIETKEMTFLFVVIGVSIINSLANKKVSYIELLFTNVAITTAVALLEHRSVLGNAQSKEIIYEKIELIKPKKRKELIADLEDRTGLRISRVYVKNVNFLRDTAKIIIYFDGDQLNRE